MIHFCKEEFKNYNDFNANKDNSWEQFDISDKMLDINNDIKISRETKTGKLVKFFVSDSEKLNIIDNQFDLYLSNLVLIHASHPEKLLREAYRVLKVGGKAIFSIWGDKTKTNFFTLYGDLIEKIENIECNSSCYDIHDNIGDLKKMMADIGFKNFRKEYSNVIYDITDSEDLRTKLLTPWAIETIKGFNEEKRKIYDEEIKKINEDFEKSEKYININILIISVSK